MSRIHAESHDPFGAVSNSLMFRIASHPARRLRRADTDGLRLAFWQFKINGDILDAIRDILVLRTYVDAGLHDADRVL